MKVSFLLLFSCAVFACGATPVIDGVEEVILQSGRIFLDELCEDVGGECIKKKKAKKCEGKVDNKFTCLGKTVCCVSLVTIPINGTKPTDKPKQQICEELDGECMSKKKQKKCKGEIDPMGKCKKKKDVCCTTNSVTIPTCENLGGECMSKKDNKKCLGEIELMGTCKGKKFVCCVNLGDNGLGPPISPEEIAAAIANSNLMKPHPGGDYPIENSEEFEGDIILTPEQQAQMEKDVRSASTLVKKWENGIIPYTISSVFTTDDRQVIARAIAEYEAKTCIKFIGRTTENDYIEIISDFGGCWSHLGRIGGRQRLSLRQSGCVYVGIAIHEFMHALGFWHEQSRYDRDEYVTINWENIRDGKNYARQFNKQTTSTTTDLGLNYDYGSIMHYSAFAFSKNGQPTITPKKAGVTIGNRDGFSELDILGINLLYNCGVVLECPSGFFASSGKCYKFLDGWKNYNWTQANKACEEQGLFLAEPADPLALRQDLLDIYKRKAGWVWLGARANGIDIRWQRSGELLPLNDPLWHPKMRNNQKYLSSDYCLQTRAEGQQVEKFPFEPFYAFLCGQFVANAVCESG